MSPMSKAIKSDHENLAKAIIENSLKKQPAEHEFDEDEQITLKRKGDQSVDQSADLVKSPEKADLNIRHFLASGLSIKIGKEVERRKSMARSIFGFSEIDHTTEKLSRKASETLYQGILPKNQFRAKRSKSYPKVIFLKTPEDEKNSKPILSEENLNK